MDGYSQWQRKGAQMNAASPAEVSTWRTSSRCDTSACVEVASAATGMWVRDEAGAVLVFPAGAWRAFLADVRESTLTKSR